MCGCNVVVVVVNVVLVVVLVVICLSDVYLRCVLDVCGLSVVLRGGSKSFCRRHWPYPFWSLSRVISRLHMLGEPWRGSKYSDLASPTSLL